MMSTSLSMKLIAEDNNDVDIRIVTLSKDGESHDYVVATSYVYKSGGLSIDHWAGCKCKSNN